MPMYTAPGMNDEGGEEEEEDEEDPRRKEEKPPDRSDGGWPGGSGGGGGGDSSSGSSLPVSRESSGSESNLPLKRVRGRPPRKRPLEGTCVRVYVPLILPSKAHTGFYFPYRTPKNSNI